MLDREDRAAEEAAEASDADGDDTDGARIASGAPVEEPEDSNSVYIRRCGLREVSGLAEIDANTMIVSGVPSGGFTSIGARNLKVSSGKWYKTIQYNSSTRHIYFAFCTTPRTTSCNPH